jgi:hypothetical protein
MAMAIVVRTCQLHDGWVAIGRKELIVLARSQVVGTEPERSWAEATTWVDFYGVVEKRVLEWHVGQRTKEQFLVITQFGLERLKAWVTEGAGEALPFSSRVLQ